MTIRELPDGTTITYTSAGRLWSRPDGDLLSVALTFATYHHCPPPWAPVPLRRKFGRGWK